MPRTRFAAVVAITIASGLLASPTHARPQPDFTTTKSAGRAAIRDTLQQTNATSVSVALLSEGKTVWSQAFGAVTPEGKRPTAATTYGIGSVSKMVTAAAVMQLVDKGQVSLDAPVIRYVPEFRMLSPQYGQVTVRMLLNHTAGLPGSDYANGQSFEAPIPGYPAQVLTALRNQRLKTTPGAMNVYCNDCFTLAGEVVARVSGMTFEKYVEANLFKPLNMRRSGFTVNNTSAPLILDGQVLPRAYTNIAAAGGVVSTPRDMLKFARVFTGEQAGVLSRSAIAQMGSDQTTTTLKVGPRSAFRCGLGWDDVAAPALADVGVTTWVKGGDIPPHHGALLVAPDEHLAVMVSASGLELTSGTLETVGETVLLNALRETGRIPRYPKPVTGQPPRAPADAQKVKRISGIYLASGQAMRVAKINARTVRLAAYSDGQWVKRPGRYVLRADGRFWSTEQPGTSIAMVKGWGRTYLVGRRVADTGTYYSSMALGQKTRSEPTDPAWDGRVKRGWLLANENPLSMAWGEPRLQFTAIPGLNGYLMAQGALVGSVPFNASESDLGSMFLQVPLMAGRDLYDFSVSRHGGEEVLQFASTVMRQQMTVPDLVKGTVTIGPRGFVEWVKVSSDRRVTLSGQTHWKLFAENLEALDSGSGQTVELSVKAGQYVALFGVPGAQITVD